MTRVLKKRRDELTYNALRLRLAHAILGAALAAGGAFALYEFAIAPQVDDLAALWLAVFSEIELLGGLWLLLGAHAKRTRPWVVAAVVGVWISSTYRVLTGKCSSGWFGSLSVNPWLVLFLSLATLVLLLRWRDSSDVDNPPLTPSTTVGLGIMALLITVAGVLQQPLIVLAGVANLKGDPIKETALTFRGKFIEFEVRTDEKGYFRLPPIPPGQYTVSITKAGSPPESKPDSVGRRLVRDAPRKSRDRTETKKSTRGRQKPPSEATQVYNNTEITVLEALDCSTNSLVIEFE